MSDRTKHHLSRIVLGLGILTLGVLFTLSNLGLIFFEDYWQYWPVILIAFGLAKILEPGGRMFGLVLGIVGSLLLLERLGKITWDVWDLWPIVLVLIGLSIIAGGFGGRFRHGGRRWKPETHVHVGVGTDDKDRPAPEIDPDSTIDVSATFGASSRVITSQDFRGGSVSTMMGGCELDFRNAAIAGSEAELHISVVFGGVEMRVPENWRVVSKVNPILGGIEVKGTRAPGPETKTLVLTGSVVLGGIEVRQ